MQKEKKVFFKKKEKKSRINLGTPGRAGEKKLPVFLIKLKIQLENYLLKFLSYRYSSHISLYSTHTILTHDNRRKKRKKKKTFKQRNEIPSKT